MKNFKQIDKSDVWPKLQVGRKVYAVIFQSALFTEGLNDLTRKWSVHNINSLLKDDDVAFYEEIIEQQD